MTILKECNFTIYINNDERWGWKHRKVGVSRIFLQIN